MCDTCEDCDSSGLTLPIANDGANGQSAYEIWVAAGNNGNEAAYLASLVGAAGAPGGLGTPGVPGAGGFITLYNDMTTSTNTTSATNLFTPNKIFSVPANTLSMNGSKLIVTTIMEVTQGGQDSGSYAHCKVFIDNSAYSGNEFWISNSEFEVGTEIKVEL